MNYWNSIDEKSRIEECNVQRSEFLLKISNKVILKQLLIKALNNNFIYYIIYSINCYIDIDDLRIKNLQLHHFFQYYRNIKIYCYEFSVIKIIPNIIIE